MQQPIEFPETDWLSVAEALVWALSLFRGKEPAEVERRLIIAFSEAAIQTRGRLAGRLEMLPPALWAGVRAISWVGSCFAAQHRSRWRNDAQEYRVSDVQVWRRSLEAWLRRAVRAAGRPSLAVVNGAVTAAEATAEALGGTRTESAPNATKAKLEEFRVWAEAEKTQWGTYPPMQPTKKDDRLCVRKWAVQNGIDREDAEAWARELGWARTRGRPPSPGKSPGKSGGGIRRSAPQGGGASGEIPRKSGK
jgi:hypothetical protein